MIINLSNNTKLRLAGADRVRYLNGQLSNDVAKASAETAIAACVTTRKGKLDALVHVTRDADRGSFLIDSDPSLRESLHARLDRYIIADDCELEDVTDAFALYHVIGDAVPDGALVAPENRTRFAADGRDVWLPAHAKLAAATATEKEVEELRIRNAVPKWGAELTNDTLPAEAGLESTAIDFHKGCYVGQEVISRIHSVGRVNRVLVSVESDQPLAPGMSLTEIGDSPVGKLTSAAGTLALGYVKRDFARPGTSLTAQDPEKELSTPCRIRDTGMA